MGLLSKDEKEAMKKYASFINFMRIAYSACKAEELKENVGRFFVQTGKGDDAQYQIFDSFVGYPVGYRGVVTSNKTGNNTVIDSKRNALFKSQGASPSPLFSSNALTMFRDACSEEGLETKDNVEVLFHVTSIDQVKVDEYLIYLFKSSSLDDFKKLDDQVGDKYMNFTVQGKPSKNEWFTINWANTDLTYQDPVDLFDKLKTFYNWK